jgi:predicted AlkP superfamily phosphohydrolase/phosphomutase
MDSADRVLVIGVDGAHPEFLRTWSDEGRLPTLKGFLDEGAYARLESVPNWNSAPAWSSMVTGVNPGKHGIFWFGEYKPQTYEYFYINASYRHGDALWDIMSRAGRKVGVINVPISYPATAVDGFLIAGLDAPGVDDQRFAYPSTLVDDLTGELGEYIIEPGMPGFHKGGRLDEGRARLHSTIDQRLAYSSHLMKTRPWDFFMVVFTTVDSAQHFFWKYVRPEGFDVEDEEREKYQHAIRDVYVHQDEAIAQLLEIAGPSTAVFIVSDHGADIGGKGRFLPLWLEHMGMLRYRRQGEGGSSPQAIASRLVYRTLAGGYRFVDRHFDREIKLRLAKTFPGLRSKTEAHISFSQIDWSNTKAFTDGLRPDIWINLKGRFPLGTVDPGTEYDEVCEAIRAQFQAMRDGRTGRKAVKRVLRREEVYAGPYLDRAPDLSIQWEPGIPSEAVVSGSTSGADLLRGGAARRPAAGGSGGHGQYGILLAKGPQIKRGYDLGIANIMDVAPTVLHVSGLPVPQYMDGRVVEEAFRDEFLSARPVRMGEDVLGATGEPIPYTGEDEETIADRLRGLGYVE